MTTRTIILPVGLSLLRGLEDKRVNLTPGVEPAQLIDVMKSLGNAVDDLSAELSSLAELKVGPGDEAVFLATETHDSLYAAKINALIAERRHEINAVAECVESLVLDNAETFRKDGLPSLFRKLDQITDRAIEQGREPQLNISGGIKPVIPYIAIYGLLRRIPLTYTFELTQTLVTLPPLPINFDWTSLQTAAQALQQIDQKTAIEQRELEALLGEDFTRLEGLFEDAGNGQVTLSTFGFILLKEVESSREKPVMLSPSASGKLQEMQGTPKQQLEILLDRVRNPIWRAQKHHTFRGTDLNVYKPGDTPHRLAAWVESGMVYVAESYAEHEEYERDLLTRRRGQYQSKDFKPYWPASVPESLVGEEEPPEDKRLARVVKEKQKLEARLGEARQVLRQKDQKILDVKKELNEVRQHFSSVKKERHKLNQKHSKLSQQLRNMQQELDRVKQEAEELTRQKAEHENEEEE